MSVKLELVEKIPDKIYYYGNKIDIINDFYLLCETNTQILKVISIDKIPINILSLISTNEKHNISKTPTINISNDPYNIYLNDIGSYKLTINFEPIKINNITYTVNSFSKNFTVIKKHITVTFNNYYIKSLMYVGDVIPIYATLENFFDIICSNSTMMSGNIIKQNKLLKYISLCVLNNNFQILNIGSEDNKYHKITINEKIYVCINSYDCYCYEFNIEKFEIIVEYKTAYINVKKNFTIKVGEQITITDDDYEIYDICNNKINSSELNIFVYNTNNANNNEYSESKLIPFLDSGIYYIKLVSGNIESEKTLLAITKYETKIINNLNKSYTHNTILNLKKFINVVAENNITFDVSYFMINNQIVMDEYKFVTCGPCVIQIIFLGCRIFDYCESIINIYIEPINISLKFNQDNYILLNHEKYKFNFDEEIVYQDSNINISDLVLKFYYKRENYNSVIKTNFTIDFKNPEVNKPITDILENYTVIRDKMRYLAHKYFNDTDFSELITKINIVLSIDLYMTCFYEEDNEIKNITVNSELWFEQLEQRYDGISGLSYDYFLVASVIQNSVVGFSLNGIFIPFHKILYVEIGKLCNYDEIIYLPPSNYKIITNINYKNNIYNINNSPTANLYLINYLDQIHFIINNNDPVEAIYGTTINLYNYNVQVFINYTEKKISVDPKIFNITNMIDYNALNEGINDNIIITFCYKPRNYFWNVPITINLSFPTIYVNIESWKNEEIINKNLKNYGTYFSATFGPNDLIIEELKNTNQLPKYPHINSNLPLANFNTIVIVPILPMPSYSYADKIVPLTKYLILSNDIPYDDNCHLAEFTTGIYIKPYPISINFDNIVVDSDDDIFCENNIIIVRGKNNINEKLTINTASIINKFIYNPTGHNFKADITFTLKTPINLLTHEFLITDTSGNDIYVKQINEKEFKSNTFIYNIHGNYPTIKFPRIQTQFQILEINVRQFSRLQ